MRVFITVLCCILSARYIRLRRLQGM